MGLCAFPTVVQSFYGLFYSVGSNSLCNEAEQIRVKVKPEGLWLLVTLLDLAPWFYWWFEQWETGILCFSIEMCWLWLRGRWCVLRLRVLVYKGDKSHGCLDARHTLQVCVALHCSSIALSHSSLFASFLYIKPKVFVLFDSHNCPSIILIKWLTTKPLTRTWHWPTVVLLPVSQLPNALSPLFRRRRPRSTCMSQT